MGEFIISFLLDKQFEQTKTKYQKRIYDINQGDFELKIHFLRFLQVSSDFAPISKQYFGKSYTIKISGEQLLVSIEF